MTTSYDRGPLLDFEITWKSGRIERIKAHQVTWPIDDTFNIFANTTMKTDRPVMFHGEFDGHWQMVLAARAEDIASVRNLTAAPEQL